MGHSLLGHLPRTRAWKEVVALLAAGADAPQIANATIRAAERSLTHVFSDVGLVDTTWLLLRLPQAARAESFADALYELGVATPSVPSLMALVGAFTEAMDARLANQVGRTDLGEMAQMAAAESLAHELHELTYGLFGTTADHIQAALGQLGTAKHFGLLARRFFAGFTFKLLDFYLSRVLAEHAGEGRRFTTLSQQRAFTVALQTHCYEAAAIVERFSGEWLAKTQWEENEVSRPKAAKYTHGAIRKLIKELKQGAGLHGE